MKLKVKQRVDTLDQIEERTIVSMIFIVNSIQTSENCINK